MENQLQIFENKEFGIIRTQLINKEPWFAAKDVCDILELTNVTVAIQNLDDDEVAKLNLGSQVGETNFINESGLYTLIIRSRKKEARKFRKWVTSEVLPSIRKHGAYLTNDKIEEVLSNPDTIIRLAMDLKEERKEKEKLQVENIQKTQLIGELKPKADYTDRILQNKGIVTITAIAKDYGMSGDKMNDKLHELGIQFKQSNQWFLYAKYHDCGYTHSETIDLTHRDGTKFVKMNTKWTQKGRLFIYELLKENDIVPVIEIEDKKEEKQEIAI